MSLRLIIGGLITASPALVGWIVAIVLVVVMFSRGGGKAERFLAAGASLMLASSLIAAFTDAFVESLRDGMSVGIAISRILWAQRIVGLAGTISLVYAFWIKFKVKAHA
jgi:hypothetical protein